jgi:hypothetical protein
VAYEGNRLAHRRTLPVCQTGLVLVDTGNPILRAECRLCGYAGPFDTEGTEWDGAW